MMIIEINEIPAIDDLPDDVRAVVNSVGLQFAPPVLFGTSARNGKIIMLASCDSSAAAVEDALSQDTDDDQGKPLKRDLGVKVLAVAGEPVDQSLLLPYFDEVPVFAVDEDGELQVTGYEQVTDLTGKLQTWAGREWQY